MDRFRLFCSKTGIWYRQTMFRDTINMESGAPRIMAFDMLRGMSIFMMSLCHQFGRLLLIDENFFTRYSIVVYILALPIMVCILFFSAFRGIFVFVSGATTQYSRRLLLNYTLKNVTISFAKNFITDIILIPIFMYLGFWTWYLVMLLESKSPFPWAGLRYWQVSDGMANPVIFFGWVGVFATVIEYLIDLTLLGFSKYYKNQNQRLIAKSWVLFFVGIVLTLINTEAYKLINTEILRVFPGYQEKVPLGYCMPESFTIQYYRSITTFGSALQLQLLMLLAGNFNPIFPFLSSYILGMAVGNLIINLVNDNQTIDKMVVDDNPDKETVEYNNINGSESLKRKKRAALLLARKSFYTHYFGQMIIGLVNIIPNFLLVANYINVGVLTSYFTSGMPINYCMTQDLHSIHIPMMYMCLFACFWITDYGTMEYMKFKANCIQYIRHFSSYSLTCYVLDGLLSGFVRAHFWGFDPTLGRYMETTDIWWLAFYVLVYAFFITAFVHAQDSIGGMMTVEKLLSLISQLLRGKKTRPISDFHLNVKIVPLFVEEQNKICGLCIKRWEKLKKRGPTKIYAESIEEDEPLIGDKV